MNKLKSIDFRDPRIKSRGLPARKKIAVCSLVLLIVAVMIVWFAFLGWGAVEIIRSISVGLKALWTAIS